MADVPDGANLSSRLSGIISDHRKNLGRIRKIDTLPIFQICPRPSQTIGDICDFEFSLIRRQNLGQSGNRKISDRLGFSRHMKTRL